MPKYHVCYHVNRTEWYEIEAANEKEAMENAFIDGDEIENSSDTFAAEAIRAELVEGDHAA